MGAGGGDVAVPMTIKPVEQYLAYVYGFENLPVL